MNRAEPAFIDADHWQVAKHGQLAPGDVCLCRRIGEEDRVVAALSDGLGSGIKANVLATLTATMAVKYAAAFEDLRRSAETIISTLPVCSVRKISYATFTIVDVDAGGRTRIVEYENPSCVLLRGGKVEPLERAPVPLANARGRALRQSQFTARLGDRIVFFSDGVTQAGMGEHRTPLGWGSEAVERFLAERIAEEPGVSARELAQSLVDRATGIDWGLPKDDITCGVFYLREPRRLLLATGPPFSMSRDRELARTLESFRGRKAIAGGTTCNIIARELHHKVTANLDEIDPEIPPGATMEGVDLVTEGTLTLGKVASLLESGAPPEKMRPNGATRLAMMLLESDIVHFLVGTRVNQAHQDPNVPVELELRRTLVKRIASVLESRYVKTTHVQYV